MKGGDTNQTNVVVSSADHSRWVLRMVEREMEMTSMELYSLEKILEGPEGLRNVFRLGIFDRTALKNFMISSKEWDERSAALRMLVYEDKQFDVEEGVINEATTKLLDKHVCRIKYKIKPITVEVCGRKKSGGDGDGKCKSRRHRI